MKFNENMPGINKSKSLTTTIPVYAVSAQFYILLSCDDLFDNLSFLNKGFGRI